HGSIEIRPLSSNLYICLITAPGTVDRTRIPVPALFKFRNIALYPAQNRRMCQGNASLRHHLDQIPGTQLETQVPPHAEDNDFAIEVSPLKHNPSGRSSAHSLIMARQRRSQRFSPEPYALEGRAKSQLQHSRLIRQIVGERWLAVIRIAFVCRICAI